MQWKNLQDNTYYYRDSGRKNPNKMYFFVVTGSHRDPAKGLMIDLVRWTLETCGDVKGWPAWRAANEAYLADEEADFLGTLVALAAIMFLTTHNKLCPADPKNPQYTSMTPTAATAKATPKGAMQTPVDNSAKAKLKMANEHADKCAQCGNPTKEVFFLTSKSRYCPVCEP